MYQEVDVASEGINFGGIWLCGYRLLLSNSFLLPVQVIAGGNGSKTVFFFMEIFLIPSLYDLECGSNDLV